MTKTILITGAGSGFGKAAAIGMATNGHGIIATAQVSSQVTPLREEAEQLGLKNLRVEHLDLTDPYDIAQAQTWDIDVLWNNAGMGEAGPVWEIPIELVRKNYEVNVFLPLELTQGVVRSGCRRARRARWFSPHRWAACSPRPTGAPTSRPSTRWSPLPRHCSRSCRRYGIKIQTINPGAYYTGYNETMADNPFRWLDDTKHFTKRAELRKDFDDFFATPEGRMDPQEMIDRMIEIVPADTGKFRNVVPKTIEDMLKEHQLQAWENQI